MKIAVCVKQVPMVAAMKFDAESKTIVREGVPMEVSAFDLRALLRAVELRDEHGGEVVALTMGPPQAVEALAECLALGADRGVHLCDRAFAGADTLATARALAAAIEREPYDLILCGRHSVDAETGQVGPEVAELLDLPQVSGARSLAVDQERRVLVAERETDDGIERVEVNLPALVSAGEDLAAERFTTQAERDAATAKPIEELDLTALGLDASVVGSAGSPTWVLGLESAEDERMREVLPGEDLRADVRYVAERLVAAGLFADDWTVERKAPSIQGGGGASVRAGQTTLVVAEARAGRLRPVTFELLAKARELAAAHGGSVDLLIADTAAKALAEAAVGCAADRILVAEHAKLTEATEPHATLVCEVIRDRQPSLVLLPATSFGRDLAPRVAARLGLGLTGECIDLSVDEEGRVLQHKPAFGGSVVALIASRTLPAMATVRPGMLNASQECGDASPEIVGVRIPKLSSRVRVLERNVEAQEVADLEGADVVVGFGMGIGGVDELPLVRELADVVGGSLCTTRDVTDAGWVAKHYQVGMTGRAIAPRVYLAVALRGAFEHMVGTRRSGLIIGINRSPRSPLIKNCDYGLVGDWREIVPLLIEELRRVRGGNG